MQRQLQTETQKHSKLIPFLCKAALLTQTHSDIKDQSQARRETTTVIKLRDGARKADLLLSIHSHRLVHC